MIQPALTSDQIPFVEVRVRTLYISTCRNCGLDMINTPSAPLVAQIQSEDSQTRGDIG